MATTMARDQGLKQFEAWMRTVGIWWNTDICTLDGGADGCSGKAYGVFAARDVRDGDVLCRIPHSAIVSIKTTDFADVIKKEKLGGGLGLIAAVMYEWGLGEKSHW
jgi:SET domain-containing protein 6